MQHDTDTPPSLRTIAWVFFAIGMQSFGGGLSGWIRREIVQRRRWMAEQQFLSGLALCQISPGPNAVNLAVFVGTTMRGRAGAVAALGGIIGVPMLVAIALAVGFEAVRSVPGLESAMAGVGAAAIGFNFATGLRMTRRGIRTPEAALVMLAAAGAIGGLGFEFLPTVLVLLPISLGLAYWRRR